MTSQLCGLHLYYTCLQTRNGTYAVVAEWLRRWTRNPLGSARTGSNPVGSESFGVYFILLAFYGLSINVDIACTFVASMVSNLASRVFKGWRGRVVKAMDLKSIGLCPHRFEPCRQRRIFVVKRTNENFLGIQRIPNYKSGTLACIIWEKEHLASMGIEPTTFALLARRSNQLS